MNNGNKTDNTADTQDIIIHSNNYNITVIPVDYSNRNRMYNSAQEDEYINEQFNNEYVQHDNITTNNQNVLYSVIQRIPIVVAANTTSNTNTNEINCCKETINKAYSNNSIRAAGQWTTNSEKNLSSLEKSLHQEKKSNNDEHGFENFNENPNPLIKSASICNPTNIIVSLTTTAAAASTISCCSTNNSNNISNTSNHSTAETLSFLEPVIPICIYLHNKTVLMMEIENTPTATCELICQAIANCDELGLNKLLAMQVFTLWLISPLLELQMRRNSRPYEVQENWHNLVNKYSNASKEKKEKDEPKLVFQRNLFYSKQLEEKIKDQKILELLYEETKYNILNGRYPTEIPHLIMLGGIQAREELGQYNPQVSNLPPVTPTQNYPCCWDKILNLLFSIEEQSKYLPAHIRKSLNWTWLPISSKDSAEIRLLEQFKRIPNTATNRKLIRKYLEYCWTLPFYGSAFFEGQIEQPVRGLISFLTHQDLPILVAINERGVNILDDSNCQVLLALKYDEFNWDYTKPSRDDSTECMPCLFIQFATVENGIRVTKMLQVFSKQASLMDALINSYVINLSTRRAAGLAVNNENDSNKNAADGGQNGLSENDGQLSTSNSAAPPYLSTSPYSVLSNKLSKLTLATFDDNGHCIGQMGSWSIIN